MDKYIEAIKKIKSDGIAISLFYPGIGFCLGSINDVKDDYITVTIPQQDGGDNKLVMHYTQLILQRD
jgi:hypothetical protein